MTKHYRILVADDDMDDHFILKSYFVDEGIDNEVCFKENGLEALQYLEAIEDDTSLPNLVILDLNMPLLDGRQTLEALKKHLRFRDIPVIIYSTSDNEFERKKCIDLGALEYLVKPVTYEEGVHMIKKFKNFIS